MRIEFTTIKLMLNELNALNGLDRFNVKYTAIDEVKLAIFKGRNTSLVLDYSTGGTMITCTLRSHVIKHRNTVILNKKIPIISKNPLFSFFNKIIRYLIADYDDPKINYSNLLLI